MVKKLLAAAIAALFVGAATAGDAFATLDADQNSVISTEEASVMPGLVGQWEVLDVDASGDLNAEEFAKYQVAGETGKPSEAN